MNPVRIAALPPRSSPARWLVLALLPLVGCGGEAGGATAQERAVGARGAVEPITVAVAAVLRQDMSSAYRTSATLRAERRATITARTRGVIEELFVEEGDLIEADQVLAKLEDDEELLAVTRADSVHLIKQREYERLTTLNAQDIISDNEVELIRREASEARLDLELAQLELERTSIRAPFAGIVVARHLDLGATVSDGTEIFDIADVDPLYVDVSVPERHVGRLAREQKVRLTADELDAPVEARIERLAPVVDATTGTVKVTVAVERAVHLRPGAFVEVQIVTDVHPDVLVVPRSALVAEGRRWLVFRPAADGATVQAVEVELGFEEGERVEISAAGERRIDEGDFVVVVGASALSDQAPVRILERRAPATPPNETGEAAAGGRE